MDRILVPLDFSSCAPLILEEAIRFARAFEAELVLLHAAEAPPGLPLSARIQAPGAEGTVTVAAWLREDAARNLQDLERRVAAAGVAVRSQVETGRPAATILAVAAALRPRLILLGTHGRTGISHALLGSVAEQVLRGATVPVVTVRTQHQASCAARSCATCEEGRSPGERALAVENEG